MASEEVHEHDSGIGKTVASVAADDSSAPNAVASDTCTIVEGDGTGGPTVATTTTETTVIAEVWDEENEEGVEDLLEQMGWEARGPKAHATVVAPRPKPGK